ncbi:MAG: diguanylate cyclase [Pseudohongiella sp.]|nr:diguanylate cyclase [Pseudohongiella sp.]
MSEISNELIFAVVDHVPSPLAFVSADDDFNFQYVNGAFTELFGYALDDVNTISGWPDLVCPVLRRESYLQCKDGTYRDVIIRTSQLQNLILLSFTDITERKRLEIAKDIIFTRDLESTIFRPRLHPQDLARYRLLSEHAQDVIWTIDPNGTITYVSPSVQKVRGYTTEEAMRQPLELILTPDSIAINLAYFGELLADVAAGRPPKAFRGQMEYLCKDGSTYWCDVVATPILAEDGSLVELLGVSRDISAQKRQEAELKKAKDATEALNRALEEANKRLGKMATTDTLTGLWNRRHFEDRVSQEMLSADRYGHPLSVLIFDIDHFKRVNDTYGHLAGDDVLVELSARARQHIRATDLACRWGGEEFMILMPNTNAEEAMGVAEKLRAAFAANPIAGIGMITASFGVATYQTHESLDLWISRVDRALYEAKASGRNAVQFASVEQQSYLCAARSPLL